MYGHVKAKTAFWETVIIHEATFFEIFRDEVGLLCTEPQFLSHLAFLKISLQVVRSSGVKPFVRNVMFEPAKNIRSDNRSGRQPEIEISLPLNFAGCGRTQLEDVMYKLEVMRHH